MSSGQILSRTILKFPMSMLVKGTTVPSNPIEDHNIDTQKPIIYALPYRSNVDLFVLQKQALQLGLPDPLEPISINGNSFNRYVFISSRHTLMNRDQDIPSESINLFSDLVLDSGWVSPSFSRMITSLFISPGLSRRASIQNM